MRYKYFKKIIKQDSDLSVLKNVVAKEYEAFLQKQIILLGESYPEWVREVYLRDKKYFGENNIYFMIVTKDKYSDNGIDLDDDVDENSISKLKNAVNVGNMDVASECKLLEFVFADNESVVVNRNKSWFKRLISKIRYLRNNYLAHDDNKKKDEIYPRDVISIIEDINKAFITVKENVDSIFVRKRDESRELYDEYINSNDQFLQEYKIARGIDQNTFDDRDAIDIEHLYSFNIVVEGSAFLGKRVNLIEKLVNLKIQGELKNTFIEKSTIDLISEKREDRILKNLKDWVEDGYVQLIDSGYNDAFRPDRVFKAVVKLESATEGKSRWGVITEEALLADSINSLSKKNIIVVTPKNSESFSFFSEKANDSAKKDGLLRIRPEEKNSEKIEKHTREKDENDDEFFFQIPVSNGFVRMENGGAPQKLKLLEVVNEGGEGKIYETGLGDKIIKIYNEDSLSDEKSKKISDMVDYYSNNRNDSLFNNVCWPWYRVWDMNQLKVVGYTMRFVGDSENESITIQKMINEMSSNPDNYKRSKLVTICIKIVEIMEKLHEKGILIGDINPNNILVDSGEVYFIDVDSYQFADYRCPVGTKEFTSPMIYRENPTINFSLINRTEDDELFAMSVLIFYILFLGQFPYVVDENTAIEKSIKEHQFRFISDDDSTRNSVKKAKRNTKRNYIWKNLTKEIREMFIKSFVHDYFYSERDWINALLKMRHDEDELLLSNEIYPNDAIEDEKVDHWRLFSCNGCGKEFWIAKAEEFMTPDDKWCKACKEKRSLNRKKIFRLVCSKCGSVWTCSRWDLHGPKKRSLKDVVCPDCDENFKFSKMYKYKDDPESFIVENMGYAVGNSKRR